VGPVVRLGGSFRRQACRASVAYLLAALAVLAPASSAAATSPAIVDAAPGCGPPLDGASPLDCQPPQLAAYAGWLAWSHAAADGSFQLMLRSPAGVVSPAPVPSRSAPFDVQLGPSNGGVLAVYSRCSNPLSDLGCGLYEFAVGIARATERPLRPPGGGSLHEPAVWNERLVFLRRSAPGGSENPLHRMGRGPDRLFTWRLGSARSQPVALPRSRGTREWPRGITGVITGLTIHGSWVAYVTSSGFATASVELGMRTLWAQLLGQGPRLIDQITAGEGNVCDPALFSPELSATDVYAFIHPCDPSGRNFDRWTRYALRSRTTEAARYAFTSSGEDQIYDVVPDGAGAAWEGTQVLSVLAVSWRRLPRPVPASFCTRSDLFC
jgi:hypothetical protein